jgi:hypothetical protein
MTLFIHRVAHLAAALLDGLFAHLRAILTQHAT